MVDKNIAKANIKEGCSKINFLDKNIKDSYLEKFKIYCLVFIIVVIFLIEKINFPSPKQNYKIDITDEINKLK